MTAVRRPPAAAALTLIFALLGAAWGGFLGAWHVAGMSSVLDRLESLSLDWRHSVLGTAKPPRGVVIAAIDDATIARAGSFPLPRSALARIIRGIAAAKPKVIAVDVLLLDPGLPEADLALADALRATGSVIAAAALFDGNGATPIAAPAGPGGDAAPRTNVLWPQEKFRAAASVGLTNVSTDDSRVPRYVPMVFFAGSMAVPSFALSAAAAALNTEPVLGDDVVMLDGRSIATDLGYHLPLRFYGPRGTVPTFSAAGVLNGALDAEDVRGRIVVIGSTAAGSTDSFATPFDRATPGVEIQATAIGNLLTGNTLMRNRMTRRIDAAVAVALPAIAVLLLAIRRSWLAVALAALATAAWVGATCVAFRQGYWLAVAMPAAALAPVAIGYGAARLALTQRLAQRFAAEGDALRPFQSRGLVELLARDPHFLAAPVARDAAVVFVDLSGFTGVTEALGPAWTRELLVGLHQRIEAAACEHRGIVMSYMGDGAMILFGLAAPRPDDAARALQAVARLYEGISQWIATLPPAARDRLRPRVGAHFGPVILSRLGVADHQHVAATGDTVNVASRLLEVAKDHHVATAVSEDLWRAARDAGNAAGALADEAGRGEMLEVAIRGRARPIVVRLWTGGA
jgi:adenylate cyclase